MDWHFAFVTGLATGLGGGLLALIADHWLRIAYDTSLIRLRNPVRYAVWVGGRLYFWDGRNWRKDFVDGETVIVTEESTKESVLLVKELRTIQRKVRREERRAP